MKKLNSYLILLLVVSVLVFQFSCKKEEDDSVLSQVTITMVDTVGAVKLKWTKVESLDFLEYILVRSFGNPIKSISDINLINQANNSQIITRTTNPKVTEFFDSQVSQVAGPVNYRLFVRMRNRSFSSENTVYNSGLSFINAPSPNVILENPNNASQIYLGSSNSAQLFLFDFTNDTILARSTNTVNVSTIVVANNNGATELVQSTGNSLVFRDGANFNIKSTVSSNRSIQSVSSNNNDFLCYYDDEWNFQYKLLRISDRTIVGSRSQNIENINFFGSSPFFKDPKSNSYLLFYSNNIAQLSYEPQGSGFSQGRIIARNINISNSFNGVSRISSQGNFALLGNQLYATPFEQLKQVNILVGSFVDAIFTQDESKVYILRTLNFSSSFGIVEEYSLPSGRLLRTLNTKVQGRMAIHKDTLYIFSGNNFSSAQTTIQKIKL